jgi:hypothetical protein
LEDGVVGVSNDMESSVGSIGCGSEFNGVVELIEEKFDRLGRIIGLKRTVIRERAGWVGRGQGG